MTLSIIPGRFSVCRLKALADAPAMEEFCFLSRTDQEISLVCLERCAPENSERREDGWRMFRVDGTLDFSLVGILAELSGILARAGVSLFALSTYDTDFIMVKEQHFEKALQSLRDAGHEVREGI